MMLCTPVDCLQCLLWSLRSIQFQTIAANPAKMQDKWKRPIRKQLAQIDLAKHRTGIGSVWHVKFELTVHGGANWNVEESFFLLYTCQFSSHQCWESLFRCSDSASLLSKYKQFLIFCGFSFSAHSADGQLTVQVASWKHQPTMEHANTASSQQLSRWSTLLSNFAHQQSLNDVLADHVSAQCTPAQWHSVSLQDHTFWKQSH